MNALDVHRRVRPLPVLVFAALAAMFPAAVFATSHGEAPLISEDPQADNTGLYAFRSPDAPDTVTLIATWIPDELPNGGPIYYGFANNVRYEIRVDNNTSTPGDDIIYRFSFSRVNEDPATFFAIRLGLQNLKTTYTLERSITAGGPFTTIVSNGPVPPPNIGPRSIESTVGLNTTYAALSAAAITTATSGEKIWCGPVDEPFFGDVGGLLDLAGDTKRLGRDALARFNTHAIAIQVPIATLQKSGKAANLATSILDGDFVIGVWASASRQATRTLNASGGGFVDSGAWTQVSRLGMPFTNTLIIPVAAKDFWNSRIPHSELAETTLDGYFHNPELALYMDTSQLANSVPAFAELRVPRDSLHGATPGSGFDFGNGHDGLFPLKGTPAVAGTALDNATFGNLLLPGAGKPRSVDIWPLVHTGLPNLRPYQLATGKTAGNPLSAGKPFVNTFLPNGGDMLRLNMAVPPTPRANPDFSSDGLVAAARLGLTDPRFNTSAALVFIPNMDGYPNGRRLEDDVTRIQLQLVSGVLLNAIGYWHDDFAGGNANPITPKVSAILGYTTGVGANDAPFKPSFPYLASPWRGTEVGP